jgi:hypothetical protein
VAYEGRLFLGADYDVKWLSEGATSLSSQLATFMVGWTFQ